MELYVYGTVALVALAFTGACLYAVDRERRRYKNVERRLRRPF